DVVIVAVVADIVDAHDVRVGHARGDLSLAPEALQEDLVGGELVAQHFDGDFAVEQQVAAEVDDGHAAFPDLLRESISPVEDGFLLQMPLHGAILLSPLNRTYWPLVPRPPLAFSTRRNAPSALSSPPGPSARAKKTGVDARSRSSLATCWA